MKFLAKIIEYSLYSLVFLLPVQTRWIIKAGLIEYQTYSLYGTDILLVLVILLFVAYKFSIFNFQFSNNFQLKNFQTKCKIPAWRLIGGLIIMAAVSVFFAVDRPLTLYKFGWLMLGVGLFLAVVKANYSRWKLAWSLLIGLGLQAGLAVWQFLTQSSSANKWLGLAYHSSADLGASVVETVGADGVGERWLRAYGGLDHPNVLGGVLAVGIMLLVGITNYELRITNKTQNTKFSNIKFLIFNFLLIVFAAALFFSFSRGAWLALAVGLAIMLGGAFIKKNYQAQKNILQAMLVSGLVGFVLFFQFSSLVVARVSGGERLEVKSVKERLESLKNSWPIIKNNWAAGVGLGNYTSALSRQTPGRESFYYQPAHSVLPLVWAETGILGFMFFLGLVIYLIITNLEIRNWKLEIRGSNYENNSSFNISVLVSLIVLLSLDHWLWSLHFGVLFFWLILGIMASSDKK